MDALISGFKNKGALFFFALAFHRWHTDCVSSFSTWGGSNPGQTQHPVIKISVCENVGQAVVVMVLLRVQLQELLNPDVGKAERVGPVPLVIGGVYLRKRIKMSSGEIWTKS